MELNLSAHYVLVRDIDASETLSWNGGAGFDPIASYSNKFTGSLDGQGYEINGLYIYLPTGEGVGLISCLDSTGRIDDLGVVNSNITGAYGVGGLIGDSKGAVNNCSVVGGDIRATGNNVGGLIGSTTEASINNSYSTANIIVNSGSGNAGGLIGSSDFSSMDNCYSTGNVTGTGAGGIVGSTMMGSINHSYATGNVTGTYSGGVIGSNMGTAVNSYWDKETTGQTTSSGSDPSYGKETGEMKTESTFVGWDFDNVWTFCDEATAS